MRAGRSTKAAVKRVVKGLALAAGPVFPSRKTGSRILTYHSVGARNHEMNVTPEAFRRQMEWLAAHCHVIPLTAAAEAMPGVAVTFDDGYRDVLLNAGPVLRELGLPATVFVVAGRVGGMLDHDEDPATSALMTWDEIREVEAMGVAIGAHGLTHAGLAPLREEVQGHEISECAALLEGMLGHRVEALAYPYGTSADYTETTKRLVQGRGFKYAVTNHYGINTPGTDRWALRRIWIDATDSMGMFKAKVEGRLDVLALLDTPLGLRARRLLNTTFRTG